MNEETRNAINERINKLQDLLWALSDFVNDQNLEKQRISMLVSGTPDLHIRKPELYEKMAPWANEKYKPYTSDVWLMQGVIGNGKDIREHIPSFWVNAPETNELPEGLRYLED